MPNIPAEFAYLLNQRGPAMLMEAMKNMDVAEIVGPRHNPVILGWAKEVNAPVGGWFTDDEKPWCGLFMAVCARRAGLEPPPGFDAVRALSWAAWGQPAQSARLGYILVMPRHDARGAVIGGHVTMYVGENQTHYFCLGGNQNNRVSIMPIAKARISSIRRPPYPLADAPNVKAYFVNAASYGAGGSEA